MLPTLLAAGARAVETLDVKFVIVPCDLSTYRIIRRNCEDVSEEQWLELRLVNTISYIFARSRRACTT